MFEEHREALKEDVYRRELEVKTAQRHAEGFEQQAESIQSDFAEFEGASTKYGIVAIQKSHGVIVLRVSTKDGYRHLCSVRKHPGGYDVSVYTGDLVPRHVASKHKLSLDAARQAVAEALGGMQ